MESTRILFIVLYILDDITEVTFQSGAYAIQNIAVITNNAVFIISIYRLKFNFGSFG